MTTAPQHRSEPTGRDRGWVLVAAATGWVVLTTVAVLLATGTWSIDHQRGPSQTQNPQPTENEEITRMPVPRQNPQTPDPSRPAPTTPRAASDLVYAGAVLALIPHPRAAAER